MQRIAADITNSIQSRIPLGTLFFTDLPRLPQTEVKAPDGWRWFCAPFITSDAALVSQNPNLRARCSFSPILIDLCYLMERLFVKVTYKLLGNSGLAALRVYVIESDIEGNRYLESLRNHYRYGKPLSWHETRYRVIMRELVSVLDYSLNHWNLNFQPDANRLLIFSALVSYTPFNIKNVGASSYMEDSGTFDSHINRLRNSDPFYIKPTGSFGYKSLEDRLTDVYNSIEFSIDYSTEVFQEAQDIEGFKSVLYNYQIESIAKMYHNENSHTKKVMPQIETIKRPNSKLFYIDIVSLKFRISAEYYSTPRGGILAENMGLGKTCICLGLICLTKNDSSEAPDKFLVNETRDYKTLSLFDQCVRTINTRAIPWRKHIDLIPDNCVQKLRSSPGFFYVRREASKKRTFRERPIVRQEKLLLTTATLIVCPDNLFSQWVHEIEKHVKEGFLKCLILPEANQVPSALKISGYDVVLMSQSSYVYEKPATSQLTKIYWKRLIIDEGHSMHHRSTKAVELSKELKVERKWAVTGTPTAGMTKLYVNESSETRKNDDNSYTIKRNYNARDDLARLGYMISNFFQIEPWSNSHDLWNKVVVKPFVDDKMGSLSSLVNGLIVRHSEKQIESDVKLPPLYHVPIILKPSHHNKVSINLFTAVLATNAISSEREDKDYMFHSSNKADLRRLVTNLQRATFYWTGFSVEDLENMTYIIKICLDKKKEDSTEYYSDDDIALLKKSLQVCRAALHDKVWRIVSTIHEMEYHVSGLDQEFSHNFAIGKASEMVSIFGAPQLYSLQSFFFKNRFTKGQSLKEKVLRYSDEFWKDYWKDAAKKNSDRTKKNDGQTIELPKVSDELLFQEKVLLKSAVKAKFTDPNLVKSSTGKIDLSNSGTPDPEKKEVDSLKSRILGTASSKLSYMVSRLLEHQYAGVKSIVFFEFEDSAYYLSEALDLVGVTYTLYATSVPKGERTQKIDVFSKSSGGHCLLMDLKLASHGLTITAATRVYFLNPVWKRSVEAQAIKRAHRIGQLNAVHVETLILEGSLEEEIFRKLMTDEDEQNIPVADDDQIQNFISRFEFLPTSDKQKFIEFKSASTTEQKSINSVELESYELAEPTGRNIDGDIHWSVPTFSKLSQEKMVEAGHNNFMRSRTIKGSSDIDKVRMDEGLVYSNTYKKKKDHMGSLKIFRLERGLLNKETKPLNETSNIIEYASTEPSQKRVKFEQ